jgi:hypothetical protein
MYGVCGEDNPHWKGGRCERPDGYIIVNVGKEHPMADAKGCVREHRLVMSQRIGRTLLPKEVVHHVDEVPGNNEVSNLWIFPDVASHKAWHNMLTHEQELTVYMPALSLA